MKIKLWLVAEDMGDGESIGQVFPTEEAATSFIALQFLQGFAPYPATDVDIDVSLFEVVE